MTVRSEQKQIYLTADMASRLAGIDIGSNSVRLLVAEVLRGGSYRILDEEREPTRLARSVSAAGRLDDEAMGALAHKEGLSNSLRTCFLRRQGCAACVRRMRSLRVCGRSLPPRPLTYRLLFASSKSTADRRGVPPRQVRQSQNLK